MEKMKFMVWYRPYAFNDEEDYTVVEAENEQEARWYAGAYGWVTDVEAIR